MTIPQFDDFIYAGGGVAEGPPPPAAGIAFLTGQHQIVLAIVAVPTSSWYRKSDDHRGLISIVFIPWELSHVCS